MKKAKRPRGRPKLYPTEWTKLRVALPDYVMDKVSKAAKAAGVSPSKMVSMLVHQAVTK